MTALSVLILHVYVMYIMYNVHLCTFVYHSMYMYIHVYTCVLGDFNIKACVILWLFAAKGVVVQ